MDDEKRNEIKGFSTFVIALFVFIILVIVIDVIDMPLFFKCLIGAIGLMEFAIALAYLIYHRLKK